VQSKDHYRDFDPVWYQPYCLWRSYLSEEHFIFKYGEEVLKMEAAEYYETLTRNRYAARCKNP